MRFGTQQHRFYCGIDLHARTLAVQLLDADGHGPLAKTSPPFEWPAWGTDEFLESVKLASRAA